MNDIPATHNSISYALDKGKTKAATGILQMFSREWEQSDDDTTNNNMAALLCRTVIEIHLAPFTQEACTSSPWAIS